MPSIINTRYGYYNQESLYKENLRSLFALITGCIRAIHIPCPTFTTICSTHSTKKKNAAFEFCEADYFLAYRDDKIVGRVAAIINNRANEKWECKNVRFGWIDFIDDPEVSSALIKTVEDWGKERGMTHITGPLGFTDFDAEGMLIEGFDQLSTMATIYNHPYYPVHMETRFRERRRLGGIQNLHPRCHPRQAQAYHRTDSTKIQPEDKEIHLRKKNSQRLRTGNLRTDERSIQPALRLLPADATANQPVRKDVSPDSRLTDGYPHYRRRRQKLVCVGISMPSLAEALQKVTRPSAPSRMVLSAESTVHETPCQNA